MPPEKPRDKVSDSSSISEQDVVASQRKQQETLLPFTRRHIGKQNLDIGCGLGIASVIHRERLGVSPVLCDVVDVRNELAQSLPFVTFNGLRLPFPDASFESSYIQYVLHHMASLGDAEQLLSEAFRVSKKVLVVEEIRGERTDVARAKAYDEAVNMRMHSSIPMPVRAYFSSEEMEALLVRLGHKVGSHEVINRGSNKNGFLEKHFFVAE